MRSTLLSLALAAILGFAFPSGAATVTVDYSAEGANEGFNDTGAADGNSTAPGATIGAQRKASFEAAASLWGAGISSAVTITVDATMDPLTCDASSAILGGASTNTVHGNFTNAPLANTWYHQALANAISGADVSGANDLGATFNSDIDGNNSCLNNTDWFYATTSGEVAGTVSFFDTVLHEIGHGLGVSTFVSSAGAEFSGFPDVYESFLEDHSTGTMWTAMNDTQRATSSIDTGDLHWDGTNVNAAIARLSAGVSGSHVQMYAPNPFESGSSVSHWDTALSSVSKAANDDEIMEPSSTPAQRFIVTQEMLKDEGWPGVTIPVELEEYEID